MIRETEEIPKTKKRRVHRGDGSEDGIFYGDGKKQAVIFSAVNGKKNPVVNVLVVNGKTFFSGKCNWR